MILGAVRTVTATPAQLHLLIATHPDALLVVTPGETSVEVGGVRYVVREERAS